MSKGRMMIPTTSGHTEFDDMILLARRLVNDDVVLSRVMERMAIRLSVLESQLEKAETLIDHILVTAREITHKKYPDGQVNPVTLMASVSEDIDVQASEFAVRVWSVIEESYYHAVFKDGKYHRPQRWE